MDYEAVCGCEYLDFAQPIIKHCNLHSAAPELLAACAMALTYGVLWKHDGHCLVKSKGPFSTDEDCSCWVVPMKKAHKKAREE